jgi:hypothetical protein
VELTYNLLDGEDLAVFLRDRESVGEAELRDHVCFVFVDVQAVLPPCQLHLHGGKGFGKFRDSFELMKFKLVTINKYLSSNDVLRRSGRSRGGRPQGVERSGSWAGPRIHYPK